MKPFETRPSPRILFGDGRLAELPDCVHQLGAARPLLVTDPGIVAAGHVARAVTLLRDAGIEVEVYEAVHVNPSESDIEACRTHAEGCSPDLIIGLGGGSSMDTAKGCNFLLNNGGRMSDFRGYGHAREPLLPFIAVPTTAGTGSECQSYAVVSRDGSHEKMACGDPKALARVAILDPELTASQPPAVARLTALDALSHAIESAVCTRRNPVSLAASRQAFRLVSGVIGEVIDGSADGEARGRMLLGAAMAGSAIENSMLGAAHATANPLTARYGIPHGRAVAWMLPAVVRFNRGAPEAAASYDEFSGWLGRPLESWLDELVSAAGLDPIPLAEEDLGSLVEQAAEQWTGQFNPRPLDRDGIAELYGGLAGRGGAGMRWMLTGSIVLLAACDRGAPGDGEGFPGGRPGLEHAGMAGDARRRWIVREGGGSASPWAGGRLDLRGRGGGGGRGGDRRGQGLCRGRDRDDPCPRP